MRNLMILIVIPHHLRKMNRSKQTDRMLNKKSKEESKNTKVFQNWKGNIK